MQKLPMTEVEYRGLAHIIRQLEFFRLIKGPPFERFLARIEYEQYDRHETIFKKGDAPLAFYIVYQGRVRILLGYRFWGLIKRYARILPGSLFGEIGILEKRLRSATAVAELPTQLFVFPYEQFDQLLEADPDFAEMIKFVVANRKSENAR